MQTEVSKEAQEVVDYIFDYLDERLTNSVDFDYSWNEDRVNFRFMYLESELQKNFDICYTELELEDNIWPDLVAQSTLERVVYELAKDCWVIEDSHNE